MNLRRQLLLVSLLTLVLPWAGCEFVRETEMALRSGQQQMLAGTAQAIADSLSQFPGEFLPAQPDADPGGTPLYVHTLASEPLLDGYATDWSTGSASRQGLGGADGTIRYVLGSWRQQLWLYLDVPDDVVVFAGGSTETQADRVLLTTLDAAGTATAYRLTAEAPGNIVARSGEAARRLEPRVAAYWQDTARGYQLEARLPRQLAGSALGISVVDTDDPRRPGVASSTYAGRRPGRLVRPSPVLESVVAGYVQPGLRLLVTDRSGWRLAQAGSVSSGGRATAAPGSRWLRLAYGAILAPGEEDTLAGPHPSGREPAAYIETARGGEAVSRWFRSPETGRAVIAVAQPVWSGNVQTGVLVLQQGTDAILSLTNQALARLVGFTLIATVVVAAALLGYATWLSQRIRRLSAAARRALDGSRVQSELPSIAAGDEIGDLSRSFSSVLRQLGEYNDYLRTLASKLSHELRTPLAIVRSSLENLEHEALHGEALEYTTRARDGVERLQKILNAMSEAGRIEELIGTAEAERFDLHAVLDSTVAAYADAWPERRIRYRAMLEAAPMRGAPELIIQLLDKLVDNAVDFSTGDDGILIELDRDGDDYVIAVTNAGPPLPEKMRSQLFDSLVSVRPGGDNQHLGLGLYIARLIAAAHRGNIRADNVPGGVRFEARVAAD